MSKARCEVCGKKKCTEEELLFLDSEYLILDNPEIEGCYACPDCVFKHTESK
jgi:hypothetical protein